MDSLTERSTSLGLQSSKTKIHTVENLYFKQVISHVVLKCRL